MSLKRQTSVSFRQGYAIWQRLVGTRVLRRAQLHLVFMCRFLTKEGWLGGQTQNVHAFVCAPLVVPKSPLSRYSQTKAIVSSPKFPQPKAHSKCTKNSSHLVLLLVPQRLPGEILLTLLERNFGPVMPLLGAQRGLPPAPLQLSD